MGHMLRRNFLIKHALTEKFEGVGRPGRGRKLLLDDRRKNRGYGKLKEEALDRTLWKSHGPVGRQPT